MSLKEKMPPAVLWCVLLLLAGWQEVRGLHRADPGGGRGGGSRWSLQ